MIVMGIHLDRAAFAPQELHGVIAHPALERLEIQAGMIPVVLEIVFVDLFKRITV
jgi:hypothetical protein